MLSCDYRSGRPENAQQLKTINVCDQAYVVQGIDVVDAMAEVDQGQGEFEACSHDPNVLPHHYSDDDITAMFPTVQIPDMHEGELPDNDVDQSGKISGVMTYCVWGPWCACCAPGVYGSHSLFHLERFRLLDVCRGRSAFVNIVDPRCHEL